MPWFLTIKPTRCTNSSNLFLEWKSTCFGQFLCPSSGIFHCTHSNGICHTCLLCVQWKPPDDGERNCPKHVEFHSKNKFEKLVHLVGFIIRNLSRCTVTWTSNPMWCYVDLTGTQLRTFRKTVVSPSPRFLDCLTVKPDAPVTISLKTSVTCTRRHDVTPRVNK